MTPPPPKPKTSDEYADISELVNSEQMAYLSQIPNFLFERVIGSRDAEHRHCLSTDLVDGIQPQVVPYLKTFVTDFFVSFQKMDWLNQIKSQQKSVVVNHSIIDSTKT